MKPSTKTDSLQDHQNADEIRALLATDGENEPDSLGMTDIPKDVEIRRSSVTGALRLKSPADEMGSSDAEFRYDVAVPLDPDTVGPREMDPVYAAEMEESREMVVAMATEQGDTALASMAKDGTLSGDKIARILDELEPNEIQAAISKQRERARRSMEANRKKIIRAVLTQGYLRFGDEGLADESDQYPSGGRTPTNEKKGTHRSRRHQAHRWEANA
ncbi:hypothetical protein HZA43_00640 [Candidatus Peregrinibacteria bacterium]|nr:hypothetical protein [Candidatus Peregrinibacteria bacterium]